MVKTHRGRPEVDDDDGDATVDLDDVDPTELDPELSVKTTRAPAGKARRKRVVHRAKEHVGLLLEGRYELVRYIASGGFGSVLEGVDQATGDRVAVKLFAAPDEMESRFWREVALMRDLAHPVLVRLLAFGLVPRDAHVGANQPYFVMEHVEGPTLRAYVRRRKTMAPEDMLALLRPIAEALDALHAMGIVHRDVKLDNILVTDDRVPPVRLIDLGIAFANAAAQPRITDQHHLVASPYYVAPEALRGETPTPAMDCYSLGICAYELMAGVRPFAGDAMDVMRKKQNEPPPFMSDVGEQRFTVQLERAMRHCLEREPRKRPQRASSVLDLLEAALKER